MIKQLVLVLALLLLAGCATEQVVESNEQLPNESSISSTEELLLTDQELE